MRSQNLPHASPSYRTRAAALPFAPGARSLAASDFAPESEHFGGFLGRRTQGWRKGWVVGYRFAVSVKSRFPNPRQLPRIGKVVGFHAY